MHRNTTKQTKKRVYCPMDWTRCVRSKTVRHDLMACTFFSNGTSSTQIAPSFVQQRNYPRCSQALQNSPKHEFRVQCSGPSAIVAKMSDTTLWHDLFSLIASVQPKLHRVLLSNETVPDAPKHYETNQNMNLGSNGVDQVRSLWKYSTQLHGMNFFH